MQQQQNYQVKPKVNDSKRLSFQHTHHSSPDVASRLHQMDYTSPTSIKSPSYGDVPHSQNGKYQHLLNNYVATSDSTPTKPARGPPWPLMNQSFLMNLTRLLKRKPSWKLN